MMDQYCIDSSSLIEIKQRFPSDIFVSLWERISDLVRLSRLFAPDEVFREIEKDPELGPWTRSHRSMFKKLDGPQLTLVRQILAKFPKLVDPLKLTAEADPFVIALAMAENQKKEQ